MVPLNQEEPKLERVVSIKIFIMKSPYETG